MRPATTANAQAAREIAERLRAICGDLRLPVLDDLGWAPALEWLCARQGEAAGSITLDRLTEESRLPADVELAFFRVAQEALSNAIRHGAPPIVVSYRAARTRLSSGSTTRVRAWPTARPGWPSRRATSGCST